MYPADYLTYVDVKKISEGLCGKSRPGHFRGVATVVNKLFNIVQPDIAYFGEKDYQQALVIKKMVSDLNMPLAVKLMPIIREADGLAMSSRNSYLNPQERAEAVVLYQSLCKAGKLIKEGERNPAKIISRIKEDITSKDRAKIDYIVIVNSKTLEELKTVRGDVLIALAVCIGKNPFDRQYDDKMPLKRIGIAGCGAIGSQIAKAILQDFASVARLRALYDIDPLKARGLSKKLGKRHLTVPNLKALIDKSDIVVECASAQASAQIARLAIEARRDCMLMSVGGLLEEEEILELARQGRGSPVYPFWGHLRNRRPEGPQFSRIKKGINHYPQTRHSP